jgi:ABC-type multidrug transport system permease subunit
LNRFLASALALFTSHNLSKLTSNIPVGLPSATISSTAFSICFLLICDLLPLKINVNEYYNRQMFTVLNNLVMYA